jgi:hypothetical protein
MVLAAAVALAQAADVVLLPVEALEGESSAGAEAGAAGCLPAAGTVDCAELHVVLAAASDVARADPLFPSVEHPLTTLKVDVVVAVAELAAAGFLAVATEVEVVECLIELPVSARREAASVAAAAVAGETLRQRMLVG